MDEIKNKRGLLSILAILLVLRFIIVPVFDWQEQRTAEIKQIEARLEKSSLIVKNQQSLDTAKEELGKRSDTLKLFIYPAANEADFRFQVQKELNEVISRHQLEVKNIGWLTRLEIESAALTRHQVRISVSGKTVNLQALLMEIDSKLNKVFVSEFKSTFKYLTSDSLGLSEATLVLAMYAQQEDEK
ncbi:hypothetical protein BB427_01880 [Pseudoalteromonas sp. BMB]|uniref:hypothetical protein n=1 Tax=Pseudoalteromonas sp. BMB TaxID=1874619 RepID=UPI00083CBF1A|nr:hypothetical protein [Pseudoalteromonas sp. BMB]ODB36786.1 hypothetical protein BB427_01880 [Pseudoalteromonas sp. BMB]